MDKNARIFVAGHRGMVGSALVRKLEASGYRNLVTRTHAELDLTDQAAVNHFFETEHIDVVLLAAARVGGILANATQPGEFLYENLVIETNVIHAAYRANVDRLVFFGSSPMNACRYILDQRSHHQASGVELHAGCVHLRQQFLAALVDESNVLQVHPQLLARCGYLVPAPFQFLYPWSTALTFNYQLNNRWTFLSRDPEHASLPCLEVCIAGYWPKRGNLYPPISHLFLSLLHAAAQCHRICAITR